MDSELHITERVAADCVTLDLNGQLTRLSEQTLLEWRDWASGLGGASALALNFANVVVINSAGIALLIRLSQYAQTGGFSLYAYGISAHYRKIFRLVGLTELIAVFPDEPSLVQYLRN